MTFTIGDKSLNVIEFSESSEPIGAEWTAWENEALVIKRFVYGLKRTWTLRCYEKDVAWSESAAKYLREQAAAGVTLQFTADEGALYQVQATNVYVIRVEVEAQPLGSQNIRYFTVVLKEA